MDSAEYFESYEDLQVHKLMLEDVPRNRAYRQAIFDNKESFTGKVVLDVGAGTGILSVFCAQAGASRVYAVEASDIYKLAVETAKENGFENTIQVIHGKIESVDIPEKVDVLISEWMGFYLLHEGMLDSVVVARDKFLKPDGLMFPESATLFSAPCSVPSMYENWDTVEGVSLKCFAKNLRVQAAKSPLTITVTAEQILSDPEVVLWIDLREVTSEDVIAIKLQHIAVSKKIGKYQGVCLWFTCTFPSFATEPVTLSTDPEDPKTHWMQTVIVIPNEIEVEAGTPLAYELQIIRSAESTRKYNLELTMLDPEEVTHPEFCGCYLTKCILLRAMLDKYENEQLNK